MFLKRFSWLSPCLLGAGCLFLPSLTQVHAASADSSGGQVDVNFFYDTLKDEGSWFNTTEYGDVWQPYIAYKSDSWRPYTDGYWSYTDGGWMFVSNENFGWAVYHYGRWTKLQDIGWAWVPGTEWAPAWVTWRESKPGDAGGGPANGTPVSATTTDAPGNQDASAPVPPPGPGAGGAPAPAPAASENYVGWAPLPPTPIAYGTDYAYGPGVDVEIGVDPYAYVFTDCRSFGDPWLAGVIFGPDRGYYCCEHSVNITNVYYNRQGAYRGFYNGGPDFSRLRGQTVRPIQQYSLQRNTSARLVRDQVRNGTFNSVRGNNLSVAAPRFSQSSVRDGRVHFSRRGALPVTPVARQFAPASAAESPAYQQARESFNRQGEAYRAQRGGSPASGAGDNNRAGGIITTPRAQQEERQSRREAEHTGLPAGGDNSSSEAARAERPPGQDARRRAETRSNPPVAGSRQVARQGRQEPRRSRGSGGGGGRAVRESRRSAAPRIGGGGFGGGGEHHGGSPRGGGGGHQGGGDKKKH